MMTSAPVEHVLLHVRDVLATDGRVGELGLDVSCEQDLIVVRGVVSAPARKDALVALVREVLEQYQCALGVRDETEIPAVGAPDREPEQL